ncbi:MAG: response regulator [Bacteroidia bacterium]|nr:response regulator [Bacteroidia bacterium]
MARPITSGYQPTLSGRSVSPAGIIHGNRTQQKKRTILLVDDDANLRLLLDFVLKRDYHVVAREDGLSAMAWLAAGNMPDLIISDLDMPRLNGYEFLCQLSASGYFQDIPVVMLSGYDDQEMKTRCLNQGAIDYLLKPFKPETILARIECLLEQVSSFGA